VRSRTFIRAHSTVPISYEVREPDRVVVVRLGGALKVEDYAETARRAMDDPAFEPGYGIVVDGSALEALPSVEELRGLVSVAQALRARGVAPFAVVTANDLQYLVARLFATIAGATINLDTHVFRTMDAAISWLRANPSAAVTRPDAWSGSELGGAEGSAARSP
jgi:hypothetical protein